MHAIDRLHRDSHRAGHGRQQKQSLWILRTAPHRSHLGMLELSWYPRAGSKSEARYSLTCARMASGMPSMARAVRAHPRTCGWLLSAPTASAGSSGQQLLPFVQK